MDEIETSDVPECRICQEEDEHGNLESPCACSGSLKFAHRKCVQHWCNEKGDTLCEICRQPYQNGYTAPTRPFYGDSVSINIGWGRDGGQQADLHEPQIFSIEGDYDEYAGTNASRASGFHSAASILMALLLLHHTLLMTAAGANEDVSTFYVAVQVTAMAAEEAAYISAHRRSSRSRGRTPSA